MSRRTDANAVEVFAERPFMSALGLFKVVIGAILLGSAVIGMARGTGQGRNLLLLAAVSAALMGFGLYDLRKVLDRRPQIRLTADGMTALDLDNVLVPWQALSEIEYMPSNGATAVVRFHLKPEADLPFNFNPLVLGGAFQWSRGGARFVQVEASPLKNARALIFDAAARFAPGLPLR